MRFNILLNTPEDFIAFWEGMQDYTGESFDSLLCTYALQYLTNYDDEGDFIDWGPIPHKLLGNYRVHYEDSWDRAGDIKVRVFELYEKPISLVTFHKLPGMEKRRLELGAIYDKAMDTARRGGCISFDHKISVELDNINKTLEEVFDI